ncbi:ATP-binding protein [Oceanicaulis sp. LC35]|uniref:sensor histidine kinase n=1 Tax=Oceanicaulis sp. LC35 TaxID=3349635 RepID=UPI003F839FEE
MRLTGETDASRLAATPFTRLIGLTVFGALAFFALVLVALQSETGWSWSPADWRSPFALDPGIWSSLFTGLIAYLLSAWVWALKPTSFPASLFAISGLATLAFCFSSFSFSLALPLAEETVAWFWIVNMLGASAFGIIMISLFLIYPTRLPFWRVLMALSVFGFGIWTLLRTFGPWREFAQVQLITTVEMLAIVGVVVWQMYACATEPRKQAIAVWLGTSVLLGAGAFIGTVAAPISFGFQPLVRENFAFAFFLTIYVGLAVGLMRYRLFDLGAWSYRIIFYSVGVMLIFALDLGLITLLSIGPSQALGVSLLVVGFAYLPFRDRIWRHFAMSAQPQDTPLFSGVLEAAFKPSAAERSQAWTDLLGEHFRPLSLDLDTAPAGEPRIEEEGLVLRLPASDDAPAVRLAYKQGGRALFNSADVRLANDLLALSEKARESRTAYDRGVSEERVRIARDLHDNIGAQLMRALHSAAPDKKDSMIRDTLSDLRDVINHAHGCEVSLDELLADLRAETADRLEPHGVRLVWSLEAGAGHRLTPVCVHALRSVVREVASNTIKHAGAQTLMISVQAGESEIRVDIRDDGAGFDPASVRSGQGLSNMKARMESVGGSFDVVDQDKGAGFLALFPYQRLRA